LTVVVGKILSFFGIVFITFNSFLDLLLLPFYQFVNPFLFLLTLVLVIIKILKCLFYSSFDITLEGFLFPYFLEHRIEPVLDLVFSPTWYFLCNLGPLVSNLLLLFKKEKVFLGSPWISLYVWREEIYPSFSALFALSLVVTHLSINLICYLLPLLLASLSHQLSQ
jgi:hypothetical protein